MVFAASLASRSARAELIDLLLGSDEVSIIPTLRIISENSDYSETIVDRSVGQSIKALSRTDLPLDSDHILRLLFSCIQGIDRAEVDPAVESGRALKLVRRLVDVEKVVSFDQIFNAYLQVDVQQAVGQVIERQLTELLAPARLVTVLEDPDTVIKAMAAFRTSPEVWGVALVEAALRFKMVASMLSEAGPLESRVEGEAMRTRNSFPGGSLYGDVLGFVESIPKADLDLGSLPQLALLIKYGISDLFRTDDKRVLSVLNIKDRLGIPRNLYSRPVLIEVRTPGGIEVWANVVAADLKIDSNTISSNRRGTVMASFIEHSMLSNLSVLLSFDGALVHMPNLGPITSSGSVLIGAARVDCTCVHGSKFRSLNATRLAEPVGIRALTQLVERLTRDARHR